MSVAKNINQNNVSNEFVQAMSPKSSANFLTKLQQSFTKSINNLKRKHLIPQKTTPQMIIGAIVLLLLIVGSASAMLLSSLTQDIRQQASGPTYLDYCTSSGQTQCLDGVEYVCDHPGATPRENGEVCGAASCEQKLGNLYDKKITDCTGTWNDTLCTCTPGEKACYTTANDDECGTFTQENCSSEPNYDTYGECRDAVYGSQIEAGSDPTCTQKEIDDCARVGSQCLYDSDLKRGRCYSSISEEGTVDYGVGGSEDLAQVQVSPTPTIIPAPTSTPKAAPKALPTNTAAGIETTVIISPQTAYGTRECDGGGLPGTCADRLGRIQICRDGLWDTPDAVELSNVCGIGDPSPAESVATPTAQCFFGVSSCSFLGMVSSNECNSCPAGTASCCNTEVPPVTAQDRICTPFERSCSDSDSISICNSLGTAYQDVSCAVGKSCVGNGVCVSENQSCKANTCHPSGFWCGQDGRLTNTSCEDIQESPGPIASLSIASGNVEDKANCGLGLIRQCSDQCVEAGKLRFNCGGLEDKSGEGPSEVKPEINCGFVGFADWCHPSCNFEEPRFLFCGGLKPEDEQISTEESFTAEVCNDFVDNDGDQLADCADADDCSEEPACNQFFTNGNATCDASDLSNVSVQPAENSCAVRCSNGTYLFLENRSSYSCCRKAMDRGFFGYYRPNCTNLPEESNATNVSVSYLPEEFEQVSTSVQFETSPYRDIIEAKSRAYGVPASLIACVISYESNGQNTTNNIGAVGLMQILSGDPNPSNDNWLYIDGRPSEEDLLDPVTNIDIGTSLLLSIYNDPELGNGDWRTTLALYNAGSHEQLADENGTLPGEGYDYADNVLLRCNAQLSS